MDHYYVTSQMKSTFNNIIRTSIIDNKNKNIYNNIIKDNISFHYLTSLITLMNIPFEIDN